MTASLPKILCLSLLLGAVGSANVASADTHFRPGYYQPIPGTGARVNHYNGSLHIPGQAVYKSSGRYDHVGNGYYRNRATGNTYNPYTKSYTQGRNLTFRPGSYQQLGGGTRFNTTTGAFHIPGQAVIKPSGVYHHIGNGYYRNSRTGNTYNPYTRVYKH